jgi:hyaluronate lyase
VSSTATNTVSVNEQINYASWNYLGTYSFSAGTNGFVRIRTDGTGGDVVSADAVRFVK